MALALARLPFVASLLGFGVMLILIWRFTEPAENTPPTSEAVRWRSLVQSFTQPGLLWLFLLSVIMYGYSHLPFVFGQPFIATILPSAQIDPSAAPLVSGIVTALMMGLSVLVSIVAPRLRKLLGLATLLLLAFAIQLVVPFILSISGTALAVLALLLRMVPDSLSTAFIEAAMQPFVRSEVRATLLSLQGLGGKLLFACTLWIAAGSSNAAGEMVLPEIQTVLGWYVAIGAGLWVCFAIAATRIGLTQS